MIIKSNDIINGSTIEADVCIIGAGAAGMTIAMELSGLPIEVVVLEAGKYEYDEAIQSLYDGEILGRPYTPLTQTRLRMMGGSTNHYAGHFGPLDILDYEARPGLPQTGWPVSQQEMNPFYERAHVYCQLGRKSFEPEAWEHELGPSPDIGDEFRVVLRQESVTRFRDVYAAKLQSAHNVRLVMEATVPELTPVASGKALDTIPVLLSGNHSVKLRSKIFVLAVGGLENPRVLLNSRSVHENGLGNDNDLVGRFFMDHISVDGGIVNFNPESKLPKYFRDHFIKDESRHGPGPYNPLAVRVFMALNAATTRDNQLANMRMQFLPIPTYRRKKATKEAARKIYQRATSYRGRDAFLEELGEVVGSLEDIALDMLDENVISTRAFRVVTSIEQLPNPSSRVRLVSDKDAYGYQKLGLSWQWTPHEKRSLHFFLRTVAKEVGRSSQGRLRVDLDDDAISFGKPLRGFELKVGNHHIGTTRMHPDPKEGVTDSDCRVHGVSNLYVAGSSVFPTCGLFNPTLTIVALAIRISDTIRKRLSI